MLSQHLANPSEEHCVALKHVLCYLKGSLHFQLCFRKCDDGLHLTGFSDASWASSDDRKSVTGYCFCLNKNGPLISWKSEAEYVALAACVQEGLFLAHLLHDIDAHCQYEPFNGVQCPVLKISQFQ